MVAAQHALGNVPFDVAFVGVGLFFALSGYLITSLLLDERDLRGSVSLFQFYLRRAARLLPALFLVVVCCNLLFLVLGDYAPIRGSVFALTYFSNYVQILRPHWVPAYGPTWTLAVEEHFYVIWPLALLFVVNRYGLRMALRATLITCAVAFVWRAGLAAATIRLSLVETGSFERADTLLWGCAAAIAVRLGWRPKGWILAVGIAGVLAIPVVFRNETYTAAVVGHAVLGILAAAVVVGLDYAPGGWVRRGLSMRPIVTIGVLSYGIYLWHGPLLRMAHKIGYGGPWYGAVVVLISIAAAAVSHRYVEAPVRTWARRRSTTSARSTHMGSDAVAAAVALPEPGGLIIAKSEESPGRSD